MAGEDTGYREDTGQAQSSDGDAPSSPLGSSHVMKGCSECLSHCQGNMKAKVGSEDTCQKQWVSNSIHSFIQWPGTSSRFSTGSKCAIILNKADLQPLCAQLQ